MLKNTLFATSTLTDSTECSSSGKAAPWQEQQNGSQLNLPSIQMYRLVDRYTPVLLAATEHLVMKLWHVEKLQEQQVLLLLLKKKKKSFIHNLKLLWNNLIILARANFLYQRLIFFIKEKQGVPQLKQ